MFLDCQAKLVDEFAAQENNKAQAFRLLPEFLSAFDLQHFTSVCQTAGAHRGKINTWQEAVWLLLRIFIADYVFDETISALRAVDQVSMNEERVFYIRVAEASARCCIISSVNTLQSQPKPRKIKQNKQNATALKK